MLLHYEMEWTTRYFVYQAKMWETQGDDMICIAGDSIESKGASCTYISVEPGALSAHGT